MNIDQRTLALLDDVRSDLDQARPDRSTTKALGHLFEGLRDLRAECSQAHWPALRSHIQEHPLCDLIHEDPMTRRSFEKPRGYAGDAVLLDYIYGEPVPGSAPASERARAIQRYAVSRPAAAAVRHRREWLGHQIDRAADRALAHGNSGARVLSVACGHLREGANSVALNSGALSEFVAIDADARSLEEVERSGWDAVRPVQMSVGRLLARGESLGRFDLIYSAGLYDYLDDSLAQRLTAKLFELLEPGGRLILTNFLPRVADIGYMETFMGWDLIYRDLDQIRTLTSTLPEGCVGHLDVREDPYLAVGTLEMTKRRETEA